MAIQFDLNALFGTAEAAVPKAGIFSEDSMHGGEASFAKKIGLSKANSVTNALKNGEDFPQWHKKTSAAA